MPTLDDDATIETLIEDVYAKGNGDSEEYTIEQLHVRAILEVAWQIACWRDDLKKMSGAICEALDRT